MEIFKNLTAEKRKWIYNVAIAVLLVLAGYGVIGADESANFTQLIAAVLNVGGAVAVGVARSNLSPDSTADDADVSDDSVE